jgi:hypothetical protein
VCQRKRRRSQNYLIIMEEEEESRRALYRKIWASPIDLFLHLTTMKMKVYNNAERLDDLESRED